jgi:hypothetical protein
LKSTPSKVSLNPFVFKDAVEGRSLTVFVSYMLFTKNVEWNIQFKGRVLLTKY